MAHNELEELCPLEDCDGDACLCEVIEMAQQRGISQAGDAAVTGFDRGYKRGYVAAIESAREAVATAPMMTGGYATKQADLAAIDALRASNG